MLSSIRNFSKTFYAKILLGVIIIPFVFWGMGSVFRGGSQNTVAKINNHKISTKDFKSKPKTLQNRIIKETFAKNRMSKALSVQKKIAYGRTE